MIRRIPAALLLCCALTACSSATKMGQDALRNGDPKSAAAYFRVAANRGEPGAWSALAESYERQGRNAEAIEAYKSGALAGDANAQRELARINVAWALPAPTVSSEVLTKPAIPTGTRMPSESTADSGAGAGVLLQLLGTLAGARAGAPNPGLSVSPYPSSQDVNCEARRTSMGPSTMNQTYRVECR